MAAGADEDGTGESLAGWRRIQRAMRLGAKGIRIRVAGRLGGSEMARIEVDRQGKVVASFSSLTKPDDPELIAAVEKAIASQP